MSREDGLKAVLGDSTYKSIRESKVLLVGAGGIGCELLKDLILLGYGEVHVVDLDTIDLSNLNRQFLFRHKDIKQPKASTAVNAVQSFNFFKTKLIPYQASIYETDLFPLSWFGQFSLIFSALDNVAARSYINKIALFLNIPIMESGTTGIEGNAQPTFPNKSECYDCIPHQTPKTFPVCTIRSTPSQPIHCIHWAKSFLFNQIFGEDEGEVQPEGKDAETLGTDNQEEIKNLVSETNELIELKKSINDEDFAEKIIEKVFVKDIEKLLKISDLWKTRKEPTPLRFDELKSKLDDITAKDLGTGQNVWSIEQNIKVFIDSTKSLQSRIKQEKEIEFDKDDEDTLNFVVSSANIRSYIFDIALKSKFDIKSIAGNIIPAIATTNAIIAGFSALLSLKQFRPTVQESFDESRAIFVANSRQKFISPSYLEGPNPKCGSCSVVRGVVNLDNSKTIGDLIEALISKYEYEEELSIAVGSKLLYDLDFDDNKNKKLIELGVLYGTHLSITDETDVKKNVELYVELNSDGLIKLPNIEIPDKPEPIKESEDDDDEEEEALLITDLADDDDLVIIEQVPEKRKADSVTDESLTKKQKADDGEAILV